MKYVESFSKKDLVIQSQEELYNRDGETVAGPKDRVFAKFNRIDLGSGDVQKKFFVLTYNNMLYDPNGTDSHREATLNLQLKPVSQETFDYYNLYLKSKNALYMTRAQRSFING